MGFIARGHPLSELSGSSQIHPGDIARAVTCGPILSLQWDIPCPSWKTYRPHWSDKLSTDLWQCNHCYLSWEHLAEFFAFRTCSGCVSWVRSPNNPFTKIWLTWLTSAPPSCQSAILQGNIDWLVGYLVAVCFHTHLLRNIIANFVVECIVRAQNNPYKLTGKIGWLDENFSAKYAFYVLALRKVQM